MTPCHPAGWDAVTLRRLEVTSPATLVVDESPACRSHIRESRMSHFPKREPEGDDGAETSGGAKKAPRRVVRRYDPAYIRFGFTVTGDAEPRAQCVECGDVLSNEALKPSKLLRHLQSKHPECVGKPKEYFQRKRDKLLTQKKSEPSAESAAANASKDTKIFCPICQWLVISLPALEDHMKGHRGWTEPTLFQCPHCPFNTEKLNVFIGHQTAHDMGASLKCTACGKVFIDAEVFRRHQALHAGERPYHCGVCEAAFARPEQLQEHREVHAGGKPYQCTVCGMEFNRPDHLRSHHRTHTGERPFACAACGKAFARLDTLVAHRRVHAGDKAYKCAVCGKEFAALRALRGHADVHEAPRRPGARDDTYDCARCGSVLTLSAELPAPGGGGGGGGGWRYECAACKWTFAEPEEPGPGASATVKRERGLAEEEEEEAEAESARQGPSVALVTVKQEPE